MTIKKTAVATSLLMAMGFTLPGFAQTAGQPEVVDGDAVTIECIPQAEVDIMSDEDKAKLTLPVCEEGEKNAEGSKAAQ